MAAPGAFFRLGRIVGKSAGASRAACVVFCAMLLVGGLPLGLAAPGPSAPHAPPAKLAPEAGVNASAHEAYDPLDAEPLAGRALAMANAAMIPCNTVFADDFSTDPNTSGQWSIHRLQETPSSEAAYSTSEQDWYLTTTGGGAVAAFANAALPTSAWTASFQYKVGGGSGADGFVFMFYKDASPFGAPAAGGSVGFTPASGATSRGFGVEFDTYQNPWDASARHVGIVQDDVSLPLLADTPLTATGDNAWHNVEVQFSSGVVTVFVDGARLLSAVLPPGYGDFTSFGFGAATGGANNNHVIDNVQVTDCVASTPSTPLFEDDFDDGYLDPAKWTVVNAGAGVEETNGRLEATVTEQAQSLAVVRGASFTAPFGWLTGVDARVVVARHVAGTGWVARPDIRVVSEDGAKWARLFYDPYYGVLRLSDSNGLTTIVSTHGQDTGYHSLRLVVSGVGYRAYYDAQLVSAFTSLFWGVTSARIELQEQTGGSSPGASETAAWDNLVVYPWDASSCERPGPDAGSYQCVTLPNAWQSVSGGTSLSLSDDSDEAVPIPFPFRWYGVAKTTAFVGSNGIVCFTEAGCDDYHAHENPAPADPNDYVACLWKDLNPSAGGTITYTLVGEAPSRALVIQYDNVRNYGNSGTNTFQTVLYESGDAQCNYSSVYATAPALVGTENAAGSSGVRYAFSQFGAPGFSVRFLLSKDVCEVPGPDAGEYRCEATAYDWMDASGGTDLGLTDDSYATVTLPFKFPWYGVSHPMALVGSNGLVCFSSQACDRSVSYFHPSSSTPNDFVACLWRDLNPSAGGSVTMKTVGASPNRVVLLTWDHVPNYYDGAPNTFQLQLTESGEARCMYDSIAYGPTALAGTENYNGDSGVRYGLSGFSAPSFGLRFFTSAPLPDPNAVCELAGPDAGGYRCLSATYSWLDVSGGTGLTLDDDEYSQVALPFPFYWYGESRTSAFVSSNGLVCFTEDGCDDYYAVPNPDANVPNDFAACLWRDFSPQNGGSITYKTLGASPNRVFVVTWDHVPTYVNGVPNTFQTQLFENGDVQCMYQDAPLDMDNGDSLVGTEDASGTIGVRHAFGLLSASGYGIRFTTSQSPPLLDLALTRGPGIREVHLSWSPPAGYNGPAITGYALHRGLSAEDQPLWRSFNATVLSTADTLASCDEVPVYTVAAITSAGDGPSSAPVTLPLASTLDLLCHLDDKPFYWGPVQGDNQDGAPDPAPQTLVALHDGVTQGSVPQWFAKSPSRFAFGINEDLIGVQWDDNTLQHDASERSFNLIGQADVAFAKQGAGFGQVTIFSPAEFLGNLIDAVKKADVSLEEKSSGLYAIGEPYASPSLQAPAIQTETRTQVDLRSPLLSGSGDAQVGAVLYEDPAARTLHTTGPNEILLLGEMTPAFGRIPPIHWERSAKIGAGFSLPLIGEITAADASISLDAEASVKVPWEAGVLLVPGTTDFQSFIGGLGIKGDATVAADAHLSILNGVTGLGGAFNTGAHTGLRAEMIWTPRSFADGQVFVSPHTGVQYRDLHGMIVVLMLDPTGIDATHFEIWANIGIFRVSTGLDFDALETPPIALAMGPGHVQLSDGLVFCTLGCESGAAPQAQARSFAMETSPSESQNEDPSALDLEPDATSWLLPLQGEPGTLGNVTLTGYAAVPANGSFEVRPWSFTIEGVQTSEEGRGSLAFDPLAFQTELQSAAANESFDDALASAVAHVDLNGDGVADVLAGGAVADERAPVTLRLAPLSSALALGEPADLAASLADAASSAPITEGDVEFLVDGASLGFAALDENGSATLHALVPADLAIGAHALEARFAGTQELRAASARESVLAEDRAPTLAITSPQLLQAFAPGESAAIGFASDATDLDATSAAWRVDQGAWQPAQANGSGFVATLAVEGLSEGPHRLEARLADAAGHEGTAGTGFVVDGAPPAVTGLPARPSASGGNLSVPWSASEPVLGHLVVYATNGSQVGETWIAQPATSGSFEVALPDGAYDYHYDFMDFAQNAVSGESPPVAPSAPLDLQAVGGASRVTLTWQPPADDGGSAITGYAITRDGAPLATVGDVLGYADLAVERASTYAYAVRAINAAGLGAASDEAQATTLDAPSAPQNVTVAPQGAGTLVLSWDAPASDGGSPITGYEVRRDDALLAALGDITTYADAGLGNNTTHAYRVLALNDAGGGTPSALVTGTTLALSPEAPRGLVASAGPAAGAIRLTWAAPAGDGGDAVTGYAVYRGGALLATTSQTSFVDEGLGNAQTRSYAVAAINGVGEGPASADASARTFDVPGAPRSLVATPGPGARTITLSWQAPDADGGTPVTGYAITRDGAPLATLGAQLQYADATLANGASSRYEVRAINLAGAGAASNEANATAYAVPSAPVGLVATAGAAPGNVTISWNAPASDGGTPITGYAIYGANAGENESLLAQVGDVRAFVDAGLPNGQLRHYRVAATNLAGTGARSDEASATTFAPPAAPTTLTASAGPGAGEISLSWSAPANDGGTPVTGYEILRGDAPGAEILFAGVGATLHWSDASAGTGATRWYEVRAINAVGAGSVSNEASATAYAPPSAPTSLTATSGPGVGQITLAWQAPASNGGSPVTGYAVYGGATSGAETLLATLGNVLAYNDTGLGNNATRYYRVAAISLAGEGATSNEANATTFTTPSAPQSFAAAAGPGNGQIRLTWSAPASDGGTAVNGYHVYRRNATGNETLIASLGVATNYTDSGLGNNTTRYYRVAATNAVGEGSRSAERNATTFATPGAPWNFTAKAGACLVTLSWSAPNATGGRPITGYVIYRGTSAGNETRYATTLGNATEYRDVNVSVGVRYYYKVVAVNSVGEGLASREAWARPYLLFPLGGDDG